MRGDAANRRNWNSVFCLRVLFVCLTVVSLLQIAQHGTKILPRCDPVYYVTDGDHSNLRQHDPDAPLQKAQNQPPKTTTALHEDEQPQRLPKMAIEPLYEREQERIDTGISDDARCSQYGVSVLPEDEKHAKRIFFGSMLADENPEVIAAHAIEVYNKYDIIALVESNTTHSGAPRPMSYGPGSMNARLLQESEIFGANTKVVFDYWLEDMPFLYEMDREVEQRNTIWKIWLQQGMTEKDIGVMADLDEIVSRDFLNALQVCDFPQTRFHEKPSCQAPKMILSAIQFEGSPLCINELEWYHPDLILGACIAGVGDPSGRVTPERSFSPPGSDAKTLGYRREEWGLQDLNDYPKDIVENKRFPLWDGRDIREVSGYEGDLMNFADKEKLNKGKPAVFGAAYHLHNWFRDTEVLRHKYLTYGHADRHAMAMPLGDFAGDVNMMVRCARGLGNQIKVKQKDDPNIVEYYENNNVLPESDENIFSLGGNRPIYFVNRTYVQERHDLVQQMIAADEAKYGTIYYKNEASSSSMEPGSAIWEKTMEERLKRRKSQSSHQ
eukprot:CAMPEP_0116113724 /NCGR_PEP_ID=MMETSP0327-20121206/19653_1 /TAXON_ID=44447 /ORGANISM="Pseudo-nitzschia delicatissima, Strain B596" /LENGTH=552 /DNA_ID=CAMNT_0003607085 /DNA_START=91 /DNA_END=1749 /DNA_ORIENTATION=+